MRNLKGKLKKKGDYPSVIQLRQLRLPHSGEEFMIGYREKKL